MHEGRLTQEREAEDNASQTINRLHEMQAERGLHVSGIAQAQRDAYVNGLEAKKLTSELYHANQQLLMACNFNPNIGAMVGREKARLGTIEETEYRSKKTKQKIWPTVNGNLKTKL